MAGAHKEAMARRGFDLSGDLHIEADPLRALVNPLGDLATFGTMAAAGYGYRHRSDIHKRLMLLATVGGLTPAHLVDVAVFSDSDDTHTASISYFAYVRLERRSGSDTRPAC
jgi:hypothetical protein